MNGWRRVFIVFFGPIFGLGALWGLACLCFALDLYLSGRPVDWRLLPIDMADFLVHIGSLFKVGLTFLFGGGIVLFVGAYLLCGIAMVVGHAADYVQAGFEMDKQKKAKIEEVGGSLSLPKEKK